MTLVVAIAMASSLVLTPLARALAWRFDAVSWPDGERRLHVRPTALWGGGAVYLGVLLAVVGSYRMVPGTFNAMVLLSALGLSAGMLCLLGCYDDRYELRACWKLLGQIVCTLPVILAGCYVKHVILLGASIDLGWLGVLFTMGWLVLGTNAMNLLDGMDGLASTVGIIISIAVAAITVSQGNSEVMLLALALAGALTGFFAHNLPPARIYLGDCGSMVIGLALSLLALQVSAPAPMTANVTVAVALLFVPLTDTSLAVIRRTLQGRGLMVADRGHVHHRLLDQGYGTWQVLGFLGGFCLATGAVAWWVAVSGQEAWAWGLLGVMTIALVNRQLVGYEEWRMTARLLEGAAARLATRRWAAGRMPWRHPGPPASSAATPSDALDRGLSYTERPLEKGAAQGDKERKAA